MKSAGKARNNGLYRHIRTSKEIIRNLLNDLIKYPEIRRVLIVLTHLVENNLSQPQAHVKPCPVYGVSEYCKIFIHFKAWACTL